MPGKHLWLHLTRSHQIETERVLIAHLELLKDYLLTIFTGEAKCKRHDTYLKADSTTRSTQLKFSSPGPLIVAHQESLAKILEDLSSNNYKDKPMHLKNYEYDVLYPEVSRPPEPKTTGAKSNWSSFKSVIWALQKVDELSYKKAESKYKMGFKRTEEEIIKSKCNEILNRIQKTLGDEMDINNSALGNSTADQSDLNISASCAEKLQEPIAADPPQDVNIPAADGAEEKKAGEQPVVPAVPSDDQNVEPDTTTSAS